MLDTVRGSFVGLIVYNLSGKRVLQYAEDKPDFELPARYRRDDKTKAVMDARSQRLEARKGAKEKYGKIKEQRDEKPVRIAPVDPSHGRGEDAFVRDAEERALREREQSRYPVRLSDRDPEAGRRRSDGSDVTRVDSELRAEQELGLEDDDDDPNIVTWYGPDDPENPKNWSLFKKCFVTFCICLITISVYSGSSIVSPAIMQVMEQFGVAQVPATLTLSLFVAGYGLGPLIWAPLTEIPAIGRNPPYILTLLIFCVLQVPTALVDNFAGLLVLRFLAGFFGSPPLATGGASVQDMFGIKTRTFALGVWGIAAAGGPAIGPVISGFAVQHETWRWAFWEMLWLSGFSLLFLAFFMPETSSENILYRRAQRLKRITGNQDLKSQGEITQSQMKLADVAKMTLITPFVLNFTEAMVFANNLFIGFVYAVLYSFFESYPLVYAEMYGMSLSIAELPFLSLLIGAVVGYIGYALWHQYYWIREFDRCNGDIAPEKRLIPAFVGACCLPICLFWFAWSSGRVHWICPTIGAAFFGIGATLLFNPIISYLTDSYPTQAASVLAANDFIRSAFGAGMPLAAHGLFANLGVNWGNSLLGFVSLLFLPLPPLLYYYGPWLRERSPRAVSPK